MGCGCKGTKPAVTVKPQVVKPKAKIVVKEGKLIIT